MPFPKDFLWGAATASYQIEGAAQEDGRGECIWTRFSHTPGKVVNGDTGDVACNHYRLYPQDVQLMRELGIKAYRFSVSWPRVLPLGHGAVNEAGLDFYSRLVDEILNAGITPFATLYHWDLPQALQDDGDGWENPSIVERFADYAELMHNALGDRIKHWITHNEPWVVAFVGNQLGVHAPGKKDAAANFRVAHHLNLSHGAAIRRLRALDPSAVLGITLNYGEMHPATDSPADAAIAALNDGLQNRWYMDAIFKGEYPADVLAFVETQQIAHGLDLSDISAACEPIDFLGLNYYSRTIWKDNGTPYGTSVRNEGALHTAMNWEVYPQGMYNMLMRVTQDYAPKALYITENGCAYDDPAPVAGIVEDPLRQDYLKQHFDKAEAAMADGAPLKGYFVWSLLDNFEWAEGYNKRFGIIHVDYATQARVWKRSARYYQQKIVETVG
ncbi:MAG: GH1 family beta-glucosidase [Phototrophicaceae bacterium]